MSPLTLAGIDSTGLPGASLDGVDRVVAVVPHPDDEALACGLLLAHAADRRLPVSIVAVTDGDAAYPDHNPDLLAACRRLEQDAALAELGVTVDRVRRVGLPDGRVNDHIDHLASVIEQQLQTNDAILLVAPSIHDWHPDHESCGHAARLALRQVARPNAVTHWSSIFWAHHHPERLLASRPRLVRLTGTPAQAATRSRAVHCHRSQFAPPASAEPILRPALIAHLDRAVEFYVQEES